MYFTGQWCDIQRCRKLPSSTAASNLRTMSENPALVWNSLGSNIQADATEIVGSPKPNLMFVLGPLKICIVCAPAIVYHSKVLVCGHAVEVSPTCNLFFSQTKDFTHLKPFAVNFILMGMVCFQMCAVSDVDIKLTTNQMSLVVNLSNEVQAVLLNFLCRDASSKAIKPSFVLELAEKQNSSQIQLMQEALSSEYAQLDSGIDVADISSIETLQSTRLRGKNL